MDEQALDAAAAGRVHYATDPRIRLLAEGRWRMETGGTRQDWLMLGKDNPEALIAESREWVRAAVAIGVLPPPEKREGGGNSERFALISEIATALRGVTNGDVWHAVGLIYELAEGRMEPADVRREFDELEFGPA